MPIPAGDFEKIVFGGAIGSGERWTTGFWVQLGGMSGVPSPAQANASALASLTAFQSAIWSPVTSPLKGWNSTDTTYTDVTKYFYRGGVLVETGHASQAASAGIAAAAHPAFVAVCVSLLTGSAGRSKRGRMYLPATGAPIATATSQVSNTADMDNITTNLATTMGTGTDTNLPGSPTFATVVLSQSTTAYTFVTSLRMDSLPDTQHGRSRRLVASHTSTHAV